MTSAMTVDIDATRDVIEMITGAWRAQALYTAVKLGLPDHIEAGRTNSCELAESTGSVEDGIHRLMRLLVSVGVFDGNERTGYRNTAMSATLLDGPQSLRDMCLLYGEECYVAWGHAYRAISTATSGFEMAYGQSFYAYLGHDKDAAKRFQQVMNAGSMFFHQVQEVFDFSGKKMVVDVGGGGGRLLSAILEATPDARGTLLEREHMVPEARQHLATTIGLERVELVGGDMVKAVPANGDVYLLSRVLAGWDDNLIIQILENCRRGMVDSSSRLIILDRLVVNEESTMLPALWDLQLLMTIGGRLRTLDSFAGLLNRAGLDVERTTELPMETTAIVAAPCIL